VPGPGSFEKSQKSHRRAPATGVSDTREELHSPRTLASALDEVNRAPALERESGRHDRRQERDLPGGRPLRADGDREQDERGRRKPHAAKVFPGVGRGFHDPGAAKIYKADVAKQAWSAAIEHLDAYAKKPQT